MKDAYQSLIFELPELFVDQSHSPKLVIVLDEAHSLGTPEEGYQPQHKLCQVISAFSTSRPEVAIWVVFASTTSKVADFSAPAHIRMSQLTVT
jgi:hypothetical protein